MHLDFEYSLIEHFSIIIDPRIDRTKKHYLLDILVSTMCAVLSGCDTWTDIVDWANENEDWLGSFLELPHGIPSHDTYSRVFAILDPDQLQVAFFEWVNSVKSELPQREIINIDGKFIRGSKKAYSSRNAIIMVSAWASRAGVSLGQLSSKLKKDEAEKKTTEKLLDCIDIKGNIITMDAMGAAPNIINKIADKKGDYVIALKDNQRSIKRTAIELFKMNGALLESLTTQEKGHGRREERAYELLILENANVSGLKQSVEDHLGKFLGIKGLGRVTSSRTVNNVESTETRYYLTSLIEIDEFSESVREHWAIENSLHWQMDVTFREDELRARVGHCAENLAIMRRLALNMLKKDTVEKRSLRRKRKLCGWRKDYLLRILFGQPAN